MTARLLKTQNPCSDSNMNKWKKNQPLRNKGVKTGLAQEKDCMKLYPLDQDQNVQDTFENDKNESKEKDLKDIFVKESSDKHDEISKTVSTNFVCDEKAISHEEKKTEKVFVKKTEKSNNDVKRKISNTEKKVTCKNI